MIAGSCVTLGAASSCAASIGRRNCLGIRRDIELALLVLSPRPLTACQRGSALAEASRAKASRNSSNETIFATKAHLAQVPAIFAAVGADIEHGGDTRLDENRAM